MVDGAKSNRGQICEQAIQQFHKYGVAALTFAKNQLKDVLKAILCAANGSHFIDNTICVEIVATFGTLKYYLCY